MVTEKITLNSPERFTKAHTISKEKLIKAAEKATNLSVHPKVRKKISPKIRRAKNPRVLRSAPVEKSQFLLRSSSKILPKLWAKNPMKSSPH